MTRRNDPCTCGSGKKYKKCCALRDGLSADILVDEEVSRLVQNFLENPLENHQDMNDLRHYERIWTQKLRGLVDEQLFDQIFSKYFMFIARQDLWKRYVLKALNSPIRPRSKDVLAMWQNSFVVFGEVTEVKDTYYQVSQALGHETYKVGRAEVNIEKGGLILGIGFPDDRVYQEGATFITAQMMAKEATEEIIESVMAMAQKSGETSSNNFFKKYMADVYKVLLEWRPDMLYDFELTEKEVAVIAAANDSLTRAGFHEEDIEQTQKIIVLYLQADPSYRKPEVIAAAVTYVMQGYGLYEYEDTSYTQKEIAQLFEVSVASMMNHADRIEEIILEALDHSEEGEVYYIGLNPEEIESMNWQVFHQLIAYDIRAEDDIEYYLEKAMTEIYEPKNAKERAQILAYEAYKAESDEEIERLVTQIQQLDHQNVDACLIKARLLLDDQQVARCYEQAITYGRKAFNNEVEVAWAFVLNRPYLRAIFSYGVWLYSKERYGEAVQQFGQVLELSPEDLLYARNLAISCYIRLGQYIEAEELLNTYSPDISEYAAHLFLRWYLEVERTSKLSQLANELFEEASTVNRYIKMIMDTPTSQRSYPQGQYITVGSVDEALYIWLLIGH